MLLLSMFLLPVLVSMPVKIESSNTSEDDIECIVSNYNSLVRECTTEYRDKVLHELFQRCTEQQKQQIVETVDSVPLILRRLGPDIELICLKNINGLVAYFSCRTYAALKRLRDWQLSNQLHTFLESVFSLLLNGRKTVVTSILWTPACYEMFVRHFKMIQGSCCLSTYSGHFS